MLKQRYTNDTKLLLFGIICDKWVQKNFTSFACTTLSHLLTHSQSECIEKFGRAEKSIHQTAYMPLRKPEPITQWNEKKTTAEQKWKKSSEYSICSQ